MRGRAERPERSAFFDFRNNYEVFTKERVALNDMPVIAMASGSIPTVFPNQHYKGMNLMDGGTIWDVNIDSAVNICLDMGFD